MTDVFKFIFSFITDKDRKLSSKAVWLTIILFLILSLDFTLGFSVQYFNEKRLDQILKINTIIRDKSLDSSFVDILVDQRTELLQSKHPYKIIASYVKGLFNGTSQTNDFISGTKQTYTSLPKIPARSEIWFIASSGGYYLILGLLYLLIFPFTKNENSLGQTLATSILMTLFMLFLSWFFYWLCGLIPILFDNWTFNYFLNFIIQNLVIFLSVKLVLKYNKK